MRAENYSWDSWDISKSLQNMWRTSAIGLGCLALLPSVLGTDVLSTSGVSDCANGTSSSITINNVDISFDRSSDNITFDASGTSTQDQYVTADLVITAYGVQAYQKSFDPCSSSTYVSQLCPGKLQSLLNCQVSMLIFGQYPQVISQRAAPNRSHLHTPPSSLRSRTRFPTWMVPLN